jgi:hypothetical protein
MSRGPGSTDRAIARLLKNAEPAETFTVTEIYRRVYA